VPGLSPGKTLCPLRQSTIFGLGLPPRPDALWAGALLSQSTMMESWPAVRQPADDGGERIPHRQRDGLSAGRGRRARNGGPRPGQTRRRCCLPHRQKRARDHCLPRDRGRHLCASRSGGPRLLRAPDPKGEIADTLPTVSPRPERSRAVWSGMLLPCYGEGWLYRAAGGTFRIPVAVCSEALLLQGFLLSEGA